MAKRKKGIWGAGTDMSRYLDLYNIIYLMGIFGQRSMLKKPLWAHSAHYCRHQ
jgi:hypothetical protein